MYTLKKSLGQHFLHDEKVCLRIVGALQERQFTNLLEVGPGGGALTKHLIRIPGIHLLAVELDSEKVAYLLRNYPALENRIINKSILDIDKPFEEPFTVIGNFPYNISSQIVFRILGWKTDIEVVVGMFQKEVAQRIAASPGSKVYGILSVLVQAFFRVEYLFEVEERAFTPPPKVKSAVIRLIRREDVPEMKSERHFFNLVKAAFNQRRKMLRNSVRGLFNAGTLESAVFNKRPEQLSVADFAELTFQMA